MADFGDPYAAMATNPYLQPQQAPDWRQVLGNALLGVGAGISNADASGRGWGQGIGPGLLMGNQMMAQQRQHAEQEAMKRWQMGMMAQEYQDKHQDRILKRQAMEAVAKEFEPGMRAPAPPVAQMGPGSYDTKLSGYEGGNKNGGMVYNELGSGAGGPYQFMPSTWTAVAQQHPELNLPATMPMENTPEARAVHDKAHTAFKGDNARALQAAGFQPTPDNLYLAHRFGVGGATSVLKADPNQPLAEVLPIDWQRQNPDMRGQTAGGFRRLAAERVGGSSVPYEVPQNAKPTQYALMPNQLPGFEMPDGVSSLVPRGNNLPQSWTAPVMPQPQATMTPAQFTPPQQAPAAAPQSDAPPQFSPPPRPTMEELPAADAIRIRRALMNQTMTPAEARAEANRVLDHIYKPREEMAQKKYDQDLEIWKHARGRKDSETDFTRNQNAEGEWVRGADGRETFVPKSQRSAGMPRYDRPPEPPQAGTEAGDYRVLQDGANSGKTDTREYYAAWNRVKNKFIDIGNNQKLPPDMRAFPEPTFKDAADRPAPTPIGERERKFTEAESKNHVYSIQLNNAIPKLEALVKDENGKYTTKNLPGNVMQTLGNSPLFPEAAVTKKEKQFRQIEMEILTGTLRPASGATILPSEFVSERQKFIPQPNDSPEQIERKLTALKAVARAVAEGTGRERSLYPNLFNQGGGDGGQDETKTSPIRIDLSGKRK